MRALMFFFLFSVVFRFFGFCFFCFSLKYCCFYKHFERFLKPNVFHEESLVCWSIHCSAGLFIWQYNCGNGNPCWLFGGSLFLSLVTVLSLQRWSSVLPLMAQKWMNECMNEWMNLMASVYLVFVTVTSTCYCCCCSF